MKQFAFDSFADAASARAPRPARSANSPPLADCRDPLIVCSFGRSGTHLMIDIVRLQFAAFAVWKWPGERTSALYTSLEELVRRARPQDTLRRIGRHAQRPIIKSHDWPTALPEVEHAAPEFAAWLRARASVIFVMRDPTVAISKLWSASGRQNVASGDGLNRQLDDFVAEQATRWCEHVEAIGRLPRALTVRFEALLGDPMTEIERVAAFIGEVPRYAAPLIIPPVRNRLELGLSRLSTRPLSSHILPRWSVRRRHELDWSPKRRALLDAIAGELMRSAGYRPG